MVFLIQLPILLFSIIVHEYAHGWMAERFGDDTARVMGRLTFNPIPHIDLFGTILLPALALMTGAPVFGWAKPVPVNPYRLNNPDKDMIWVSLAGPLSNLGLAVIAAFMMWAIRTFQFMPHFFSVSVYELLRLVLVINVLLPVFNLVPIPPLDGSKVLMGLLPSNLAYRYAEIENYGFFIIIILLSSGIFWRFLGPIINFLIVSLGGSSYYN
ncbi:MAG: site-2 protease family protein [Elusimicrobia bacterium]|nr:site-2 protease family protein [Candidatus Liberimonas magnetica]